MALTFYARGDSRTANNDEINVDNTNKTPVTELTFEAADGGDLDLDFNDGQPDPDTVLIIDGVARSFTLELTGDLPQDGKFADIGGQDIGGVQIVVITDSLTGQRYVFLNDPVANTLEVVGDLPNGGVRLENVSTTEPPVICFAAGTPIGTPDGPRRVEAIRPGDPVLTDAGPVEVVWSGANHVGADEMRARPEMRPVTIRAGAFGPGVPAADLTLSPDHRLLFTGARVEMMTGHDGVLVAAKFLTGPGIRRPLPDHGVTWCHLLLASHRVMPVLGTWAESLSGGARARAALGRTAAGIDPALLDRIGPPPRPILKAWEARALLDAGALIPA